MLPRRVITGMIGLALAAAPATVVAQRTAPATVVAQRTAPATIREYQAEMITDPFSDPNSIPVVGKIYPYFRFDGFTDVPTKRSWKVIDLENRWIRVSILPEIGGKIWRAVDKATGKSFIYDNHVVKFRDIAMRGPWTSGGIEANYGIIGHTPTVATPVDYVTQRNPDGSVTCTIGALDLLTRTSWRLAITLPADKAYFTTSSFWHNGTPFEQPYYSWMNAAIPAASDLEFIYPGNRYIGHAGELGDWPVNHANGKEISFYRNNDFGGYKSYHVFGSYTDFFGAYWHDQDFGMARYAPHDEKPGKKLWIWGLSRQGMIWEQLLTDADGQYTELQSGRLFNQTTDASTLTPFKHRGFAPYSSDRWTEYWFPVQGTDGFVMANPWGALNVQPGPHGVVLSFSPVQQIADSIEVFDGMRRIYARMLRLTPLQRWRDTAPAVADPSRLRVSIGGHKVEWSADPAATALARPVTTPAFDWTSPYGIYLTAKEKIRERDFVGAEHDMARAVAADSGYLPALTDLASLALQRGDTTMALRLARRGLAIDTYDPAANFVWGEANWRAGHHTDARDGYDIAAESPAYRSPAYTGLARIYLGDENLGRAVDYAVKALDYDRFNLDAWRVKAVAHRLQHDRPAALADLAAMEALDPLSHFAHFEAALWTGTDSARRAMAKLIRNEMPGETLLELAIWYRDEGQFVAADQLLALARPDPVILYWRAFLHDRLGLPDVAALLVRADSGSPRLVFPSRVESAEVMEWAIRHTASWLPRYFLGLIRWSEGDSAVARTLFTGMGNTPAFAPFYAARADLMRTAASAAALADLQHAAALDPGEWRYGRLLAERALADSQYATASGIAASYYQRFPHNAVLGIVYARALLRHGEAEAARRLLDTLNVLPYEGAGEAHALYREANLLVAVARIRRGEFAAARTLIAVAREWPERLGAGKPYPADLDEQLEDLLDAWASRGPAAHADLQQRAQRMLGSAAADPVVASVLGALAAPAAGG